MVAPFHDHISEETITSDFIVTLRHNGGLSGYNVDWYDLDEEHLGNNWFVSEELARARYNEIIKGGVDAI